MTEENRFVPGILGAGGSDLLAAPSLLPNDSSPLPPPEPRDKEGTRPKTDWQQVVRQVKGIQTACAMEREHKTRAAKTRGKDK